MTPVRLSTMLAAAALALPAPAAFASTPPEIATAPLELATAQVDTAAKTDADMDIAGPQERIESAEWAGPTDWAALAWHPGAELAARSDWTMPAPRSASPTHWSRTENADGSAAVTIVRTLPFGWDSAVGAEFNLAAPPPAPGPVNPGTLFPGAAATPSAGAAWAAVETPALDAPFGFDKATIAARVDPSQDLGKLGVNASKSLPLVRDWSLTLQGGFAVTDSLASPAPGLAGALGGAGLQTTEQTARLTILPTQTTVAAARTASSTDTRWYRSLSAEQRLFDGASIVGSVKETPEGPLNTSIVARFRRSW